MGSSLIILYTSIVSILAAMTADGQINRYINPAWLEMDANSEYYPGGEVIGQILRAYGLTAEDGGGGVYGPGSRAYRPSATFDRNGYGGGRRYYARNRVADGSGLSYAYDADPLTVHDRDYDYADNTIRGSNMYRKTLMDVPLRRNRINVASVPRTSYYQSDYDVDRDSLLYNNRYRSVAGDPLLQSRSREMSRLIPRSTVIPATDDKPKKT